jgi:NTP pyrophosphatase (non-canonical NTP hydrolase)
MTIKEIQENAKELNAHFKKKTPEQRVLYLMTEVGEVAEEVLKVLGLGKGGDAEKAKESLGMEIYDVVWNLCDLANMLEIDLEKSFAKKMRINKGRW